MGGAENHHTDETVFPPVSQAWTRPANGESPSSRPANRNAKKKPVARSPANTRVKQDEDAKVQVCTHLKGGICTVHGPGAKLCWTPGKWVKGEKIEEKRNYFYVCESNKKPKKKGLIQMKLSFARLTDDAAKVKQNKRRQEGEQFLDFGIFLKNFYCMDPWIGWN